MSTETYSAELAGIVKRFDDDLTALGEKVRTELVMPACKKYRLTFSSGNGTFDFRRSQGDAYAPVWSNSKELDDPTPHGHRPLSEAAKTTLRPILDILNEKISHGQYLGYFVADVD